MYKIAVKQIYLRLFVRQSIKKLRSTHRINNCQALCRPENNRFLGLFILLTEGMQVLYKIAKRIVMPRGYYNTV